MRRSLFKAATRATDLSGMAYEIKDGVECLLRMRSEAAPDATWPVRPHAARSSK
jgi:hypothetical protein